MSCAGLARLTHVALLVKDLERSIGFYRDICGLVLVHRRTGRNRDAVAWLADQDRPDPSFALVLIQPGSTGTGTGPFLTGWSHVGIGVSSRDSVDEYAARARSAGCLRLEPTYVDAIVGYVCILADPDGNGVEFSHGQVLGRPLLDQAEAK